MLIAMLKENDYEGSITIERENYGSPNREQEIQDIKEYLIGLIEAK